MQKKIFVPLADGVEEIEFVSIVDILRRSDIAVSIVGIDGKKIYQGANQICIQAEDSLADCEKEDIDGIVLAGGYLGMQNFCASQKLLDLLLNLYHSKKLVAAICASPIVLHKAGLPLKDFTCYPGCEELIGKKRSEKRVVQDANLITGSAPGVALEFALELVAYLCGTQKREALKEEMLIH